MNRSSMIVLPPLQRITIRMFLLLGVQVQRQSTGRRSCKIIYTSIFTKIDEVVHHDLEALNAAITNLLEAHNNTLLTGCDYIRRGQFEALERDVLKPLNKYGYDPMTTKVSTLGKTGYVTVDHRYYSIHYKFIGKKIKLMYNLTKVEAYSEHQLIAAHMRSFTKEKFIQNEQHLASWHRYPTEWNPEKFIADGMLISQVVADFIEKYWPAMNTLRRITVPAGHHQF